MEAPSLAMIPTGFKDGKLYSVLPESGVGDFDVVRGSGATRVNKEGLVEDVRILSGELITNGDFSNGSTDWTLGTGWSILDGKATSDGTTSNLLQSGVGSANKLFKVVFTISDYVSGSMRPAFVGKYDDSSAYNANGTYTTYISSLSDLRFVFYSNSFDGSVDNVSVVEVTDATNIPRLDYTDGGCPSLLLEPQSTNLVTYSEDFSDASWIKQAGSIGDNQAISPDGTLNADKLIDAATAGVLRKEGISLSALDYTFSVFAKKDDRDYLLLITGFGTGTFDLDNGVVISSTLSSIGKIEEYTNGWYKCSLTFTATASSPFFRISTSGSQPIINGTSGVYIWGAQLEALPYATSYIPTSGAIATRLADSLTGAGDATTFNDSEGVLYFEGSALADDGTSRRITLFKDLSNKVSLILSSTSNSIQGLVVSGGSVQFNQTFAISNTLDFNKIAFKYKTNDFAIWVNGVEVATDTSGNTPIGLSQLSFADGDNTLNVFTGKVKDVRTYNTALTDAELLTLTTI